MECQRIKWETVELVEKLKKKRKTIIVVGLLMEKKMILKVTHDLVDYKLIHSGVERKQ